MKRDFNDDNHCSFQLSPFDVRIYASVLTSSMDLIFSNMSWIKDQLSLIMHIRHSIISASNFCLR